MGKCIKCNEEYKTKTLHNYNLNLCPNCYKKFPEKIQYDEFVDKVTHRVTCPKCKKVYDKNILHKKCKTKGCDVWFFQNESHQIIARWIDI